MPLKKLFWLGACLFILPLLCSVTPLGAAEWPQVAFSKDGSAISFEVHGAGEPTLVFVHGWSCDARYWRKQVPYFAKRFRVVTLDLAGHGHSGQKRTQYSIPAFGEDVCAVTEAVGAPAVILIGHSMGGAVIAQAARRIPGRVIGLIGVDTLQNIEYPMTREELDQWIAPMKKDFRYGSRSFVADMMLPYMDPALREWILADMAAAPPAVAVSALQQMMSLYITGGAAEVFDAIQAPVVCVNADLWPVNYEANRRHMAFFETITLQGADHFLMLNRGEEFNRALEKAIDKVRATARAKGKP